MRFFFGIALLFILPLAIFATPISQTTAYQTAMEWYGKRAAHSKAYISRHTVENQLLQNSYTYCFTLEDDFVLIGGTEESPHILGYGTTHTKTIPTSTLILIDAQNKALQFTEQTSPQLNGRSIYKPAPDKPVKPFVPFVRHQEEPFNASCPVYRHSNGSEEKTIVGCVATALEQVISYYKYPAQILDTLYGWTTSHYAVDTIPTGTAIDYENILAQYNEGEYNDVQVKAVADLSYYCGIATHMNWGPSSSGANISNLIKTMRQSFGYKYVRHIYSSDFNAENWHKLLYEELRNHRPILFAGYTTAQAGHAFIVDGIDADGMYHILWGYGGEYDGYFDLSILNTYEDPRETTPNGQLFGCYCNQEVLLLHPDTLEYVIDCPLSLTSWLKIDSVRFTRQPDLNRYVTAKIFVRNISDETVISSFLLTTYPPGKKDVTEQDIDYVALAGCELAPHSSECLTAYCTFTKTGQRILTGFTDDSTSTFCDTIEVAYSKAPKVNVDILPPVPTASQVTLNVKYSNTSETYWSGNHVFYCLYEGDYNPKSLGMQHYTVLNLQPGGNFTDSVTFSNLKPDTKYTIIVRNTWSEMHGVQFTTLQELSNISNPLHTDGKREYYNLDGIKLLQEPAKGIYIIKDSNKTTKIFKK